MNAHHEVHKGEILTDAYESWFHLLMAEINLIYCTTTSMLANKLARRNWNCRQD